MPAGCPKRTGRDSGKDSIMLRAMDSAVAGLRAHQSKLDVIGNNIANVNTFGFKAQTFTFKEAMYQSAVNSTGGVLGTAAGTNGRPVRIRNIDGFHHHGHDGQHTVPGRRSERMS